MNTCPPVKYLSRLLLSLFILLLALPLYAHSHASQKNDGMHLIDLSHYLGFKASCRVVDFVDHNTLLTENYAPTGPCALDFWDVRTSRIRETITSPTPVVICISFDGLYMAGLGGTAANRVLKTYDSNVVYVWDLRTRHLVKTIELGAHATAFAIKFMPGAQHRLIVQEDPTNDKTNFPQFLALNALSGHVVQALRFKYASIGDLVFSPDGKLMVGLVGDLEVFDAHPLRFLYEYPGRHLEEGVEHPAFFVSNRQIDYAPYLYDLQRHRVSPILPGHPNLQMQCLAPIPHHLGYALFQVTRSQGEDDIELWNILANKKLHSWPLPRPPRQIAFGKSDQEDYTDFLSDDTFVSPDGKAFCLVDENHVAYVYDYDFNKASLNKKGKTAAGFLKSSSPKTLHPPRYSALSRRTTLARRPAR